MMGVRSAGEFAKVLACVGLSQNFAALRALALEGIQKGHMRLHARNLAMSAGANENEIDKVVKIMDELKEVSDVSAKKALTILRGK
jgi:hydroxymethylglutaryl-CoA reductase